MNYPYDKLIAALVTRINSETGLNVYTIVPDNASMPYVLIEDFTFGEVGNKQSYIYEFDVTYNIMMQNPTSIKTVNDAIGAILSTSNKVNGITVQDYTMIKNDVIGTSTRHEEINGINYYSAKVRIKYYLT